MTNIDMLIKEGRLLELYLESEQTDAGNDILDEVWQSVYDVYHLVVVGIIEGETDDEDMLLAKEWLLKAKGFTESYQSFIV